MAISADKRILKNDEIKAPSVRVIDESGKQIGIMPLQDALKLAGDSGLDLVEVSPQMDPPVCRTIDYGKFVFDKSKSQQSARKKARQMQIKEIKFRPGTEEGDYQVKLRNLKRFLEEGDKAKVSLRFRGREMAHAELGEKLLNRIQQDLSEYANVEQFPRLEGRQMIMVLAPKKH